MPKSIDASSTPWNRIYFFILLFNAALVVVFYLITLYFNID